MADTAHHSVLVEEVVRGLKLAPGQTFVDATVGLGGHSARICSEMGGKGRIIGFDLDETTLATASERIRSCGCEFTPVAANFRVMAEKLRALEITEVHGILFDLGWSSVQLADSGRGFSFMKEEPLLMTLSTNATEETLTARNILNEWDLEDIANVLKGYGEERFAFRIARAICEARGKRPIETTTQLTEIVTKAVPGWYRGMRIHPATRTFQALRIAVNDELGALADGLHGAMQMLTSGGRLLVISFHSLEDRIVKRYFKDLEKAEAGKILTKKPIIAGAEEVTHNPRSRSAKMRIIEKI